MTGRCVVERANHFSSFSIMSQRGKGGPVEYDARVKSTKRRGLLTTPLGPTTVDRLVMRAGVVRVQRRVEVNAFVATRYCDLLREIIHQADVYRANDSRKTLMKKDFLNALRAKGVHVLDDVYAGPRSNKKKRQRKQ